MQKWDVVYGALPHADGIENHYGVVILSKPDGQLLVAPGTSQHIPHDSGFPCEAVLRPDKGLGFAKTGLRKATRFDCTRIQRVPSDMAARLQPCGSVKEVLVGLPHSGQRPIPAPAAFERAMNAALAIRNN